MAAMAVARGNALARPFITSAAGGVRRFSRVSCVSRGFRVSRFPSPIPAVAVDCAAPADCRALRTKESTMSLSIASRLALTAACTAAFACAGAQAAERSGAAAQYKSDLAACDSSRATEERTRCRTEAGRAYSQAKAGDFNTPSDQLAQNARRRCEALKGDDRGACEARMSGAGSTEGSVGGGGILRESTRTVPAR
jgi:hypothetical protein